MQFDMPDDALGRQAEANSSVARLQARIPADSSAGRMSSKQYSSDEAANGMHAKHFPSAALSASRDK